MRKPFWDLPAVVLDNRQAEQKLPLRRVSPVLKFEVSSTVAEKNEGRDKSQESDSWDLS